MLWPLEGFPLDSVLEEWVGESAASRASLRYPPPPSKLQNTLKVRHSLTHWEGVMEALAWGWDEKPSNCRGPRQTREATQNGLSMLLVSMEIRRPSVSELSHNGGTSVVSWDILLKTEVSGYSWGYWKLLISRFPNDYKTANRFQDSQ